MGLEDDIDDSHHDDVDGDEDDTEFPSAYHCSGSVSVGLDKLYILLMARAGDRLASVLDNHSVSLHSVDSLASQGALKGHTDYVTGVVGSENMLYTSSRDQTVRMWDVRLGQCVSKLTSDKRSIGPGGDGRPLTCVSLSCNGNTLVAGTEQVGVDSYLLFWDMRNTAKLSGGYWDSHNDDITTVKFHPSSPDSLASGSTDGQVNMFDLSQTDEDNALVTSHNTEDSVASIVWYTRKQNNQQMAILTHTECVQLWDVEDYSPHSVISREDVTHGIRRKSSSHCYIAGLHPCDDGGLVMVAGSSYTPSPALRLANIKNKKVKPLTDLTGGGGCVVRSSLHIEEGVVITGGEEGVVRCWKQGTAESREDNNTGKIANKKDVREKPY